MLQDEQAKEGERGEGDIGPNQISQKGATWWGERRGSLAAGESVDTECVIETTDIAGVRLYRRRRVSRQAPSACVQEFAVPR